MEAISSVNISPSRLFSSYHCDVLLEKWNTKRSKLAWEHPTRDFWFPLPMYQPWNSHRFLVYLRSFSEAIGVRPRDCTYLVNHLLWYYSHTYILQKTHRRKYTGSQPTPIFLYEGATVIWSTSSHLQKYDLPRIHYYWVLWEHMKYFAWNKESRLFTTELENCCLSLPFPPTQPPVLIIHSGSEVPSDSSICSFFSLCCTT